MSRPATAANTITPRITSAITTVMGIRDPCLLFSRSVSAVMSSLSCVPHARVDEESYHVHRQVDDNHEGAETHGQPLYDG